MVVHISLNQIAANLGDLYSSGLYSRYILLGTGGKRSWLLLLPSKHRLQANDGQVCNNQNAKEPDRMSYGPSQEVH